MLNIWAMIVAAGQGTRLGMATAGVPKQFLNFHGAPLYWASIRVFAACARIRGILLVFPESYLDSERQRLLTLGIAEIGLPWLITAGGNRRQDSVRLGLEALQEHAPACNAVLIHDAARPFASPALVNRVIDTLHSAPGVVPALPLADTVKEIRDNAVYRTLDRTHLAAVQTPQGFQLDVLLSAHRKALQEQWNVTDDASLLEYCGQQVLIVPGNAENCKITMPEDLTMLQEKETWLPCTGWGYDVHRFAENDAADARPCRLGGIAIPNAPYILAHSDGDVLLHALMDAILGTCGKGDIGLLFPDSDPAFSGADSAALLAKVLHIAEAADVRIVHADLTIITQIPKISPYREAIRRNIAHLLLLEMDMVNIKATTEEYLGFTGQKLGMKAVAAVSALRKR